MASKIYLYSKTCLEQPLKNRQNKDIKDKWYINEGWPALSNNHSWKPIFVFFLSGRLRQVLLYMYYILK